MKIGVWLDSDYNPQDGGASSYYGKLINTIDEYDFSNSVDIVFLTYSTKEILLKKEIIHLKPVTPKINSLNLFIYSLIPFIGKKFKRNKERKIRKENINGNINYLKKNSVKLIYYLRQSECEFPDFPFIATNWDIGHCSTYSFPELTADGQHERRSRFYQEILPKALFIFCESEAGKNELIRFTNILEKKIKIVPLFAGNCINIKTDANSQTKILNTYNLNKNKFFFYPAQYWPHKNHIGLINAFKEITKMLPEYKLVFSGSDKGNCNYLKSVIEKEKLSDKILLLGFVSNEEINTFYLNASCLIMASYFGPTNMPPIEAMELGCPVICSDIAGHKEILKDSALYFSPDSIDEIIACMKQITDNNIRKEKLNLLNEVKAETIFKVEYSIKQIDQYLSDAVNIRNNWD